jgi:hypothetical protein
MTTEQTELGRFLRTRRAGVRPADMGLPAGTGARRTPWLRREELAALAGAAWRTCAPWPALTPMPPTWPRSSAS